jgi:hypothetical protein
MTTYAPNQLHLVPLAELQPDPMQPRKYLGPLALEELTASVGQVGIIEPVVFDAIRQLMIPTIKPRRKIGFERTYPLD